MTKGGCDACPPGSPYHEYILRYEDVMTFGAMPFNPLPSSAFVGSFPPSNVFPSAGSCISKVPGEKCQPAHGHYVRGVATLNTHTHTPQIGILALNIGNNV